MHCKADIGDRSGASSAIVLPSSRFISTLVRAGSARHQKPLVLGGHERSRSGSRDRRSQAVHRDDLGRRSSMAPGSTPRRPTAAVGLRPLPTRQVVADDGHRRARELLPTLTGPNHVGPRRPCHSRATSDGQARCRADNHGHLRPTAELAVSRARSVDRIQPVSQRLVGFVRSTAQLARQTVTRPGHEGND
jgi:hypothetical protein